jgi:hypothetical protein
VSLGDTYYIEDVKDLAGVRRTGTFVAKTEEADALMAVERSGDQGFDFDSDLFYDDAERIDHPGSRIARPGGPPRRLSFHPGHGKGAS